MIDYLLIIKPIRCNLKSFEQEIQGAGYPFGARDHFHTPVVPFADKIFKLESLCFEKWTPPLSKRRKIQTED